MNSGQPTLNIPSKLGAPGGPNVLVQRFNNSNQTLNFTSQMNSVDSSTVNVNTVRSKEDTDEVEQPKILKERIETAQMLYKKALQAWSPKRASTRQQKSPNKDIQHSIQIPVKVSMMDSQAYTEDFPSSRLEMEMQIKEEEEDVTNREMTIRQSHSPNQSRLSQIHQSMPENRLADSLLSQM